MSSLHPENIPDFMMAVRQTSSGGKLTVEKVPVPVPGPGEVLVKMAAAPLNPSDISFIKGIYGKPDQFPFTPGFEGSGIVVAAGKGFLPQIRNGKKVACSIQQGRDGTWAGYMVTSATNCVPLSHNIDLDQGAMWLVNPMTAMALVEIALREKHRAIVNNAAASALGKMLVSITEDYHLPLINIVRKKAQEEILKRKGAKYILNSERKDFRDVLHQMSRALNATLFLDAIGGEAGSLFIEISPPESKIIAYAKLSGKNIEVDSRFLLRENKVLEGFQLGNYLKSKNMVQKIRLVNRVKKFMKKGHEISIQKTFPLQEINRAIELYTKNMSAGKVLLKP
ncbi:MAG TPA: alcohol dehydrogenase [Bacteroidaceae bacterium]|nr:alcohol dehydrogenase [Bacteroidaceae bacterium]